MAKKHIQGGIMPMAQKEEGQMERDEGNTEAKINAEQRNETIIKEKVVIIRLYLVNYHGFFVNL